MIGDNLRELSRCLTEMFGGDWFLECHCIVGWRILRHSTSSGYCFVAAGDTLPEAVSNTLTAMVNQGE